MSILTRRFYENHCKMIEVRRSLRGNYKEEIKLGPRSNFGNNEKGSVRLNEYYPREDIKKLSVSPKVKPKAKLFFTNKKSTVGMLRKTRKSKIKLPKLKEINFLLANSQRNSPYYKSTLLNYDTIIRKEIALETDNIGLFYEDSHMN